MPINPTDCVPLTEGAAGEIARSITKGTAKREDVIAVIADSQQAIHKVLSGLITPCIDVLNANDKLLAKVQNRIRKMLTGGLTYSGSQLDFVLGQLHQTALNKTVENGIRLQALQTAMLIGETPLSPSSSAPMPDTAEESYPETPAEEETPSTPEDQLPSGEPAGAPPILDLPIRIRDGMFRMVPDVRPEDEVGPPEPKDMKKCCDDIVAAIKGINITNILQQAQWQDAWAAALLWLQQFPCLPDNPKQERGKITYEASHANPIWCQIVDLLKRITLPQLPTHEWNDAKPEPYAYAVNTYGESARTDEELSVEEVVEEGEM